MAQPAPARPAGAADTAKAGAAEPAAAPGTGAAGLKAEGVQEGKEKGPAQAAKGPGAGPGGAGPGGAGAAKGEEGEPAKKKRRPAGCFGGSWTSMIFLVLMFAVFYFLLIRPQQKKQKEHQAMLSELKVGDQVVTQGGMLGKITGFSDPFVVLEIQEKVRVKVLRSSVSGRHGGADKQGK